MAGGDPERVLAWPLRLFWSAAGHVDRLEAARDLRLMDLLVVSGGNASGEAFSELRGALVERVGTTVVREAARSSRSDILDLQRLANGG